MKKVDRSVGSTKSKMANPKKNKGTKSVNTGSSRSKLAKSGRSSRKGGKEPIVHLEPDTFTDKDESAKKQKEKRHRAQRIRYAAENLISLIVPISLCMIFVLSVQVMIKPRLKEKIQKMLITPYAEPSDAGQIWINVLCILAAIIIMTFLIVLCVKFNLFFLFYGFMCLVLFIVMFLMTFTLTLDFVNSYNVVFDWISVLFFVYNFGVVALISMFGSFPDFLRKFYTCLMCCMVVIQYVDFLDHSTTFALLAVLVVWDIFAVLTPCGPLRMLVNLLKQKGDVKSQLPPGLVYSTLIYFMADKKTSKRSVRSRASKSRKSSKKSKKSPSDTGVDDEYEDESDEDDYHGVHLGLGDFVFYSLLIGKAADYRLAEMMTGGMIDWNTILACYIVILIGLIGTVVILLVMEQALPALPISLTLGLIFYFGTWYFITPFVTLLSIEIVFL